MYVCVLCLYVCDVGMGLCCVWCTANLYLAYVCVCCIWVDVWECFLVLVCVVCVLCDMCLMCVCLDVCVMCVCCVFV